MLHATWDSFYVTSGGLCFKRCACFCKGIGFACVLCLRQEACYMNTYFERFWWVCVCAGVCPWMIRRYMLPTSCYSGCFLTLACPVLLLPPTILLPAQTPEEARVGIICLWVMKYLHGHWAFLETRISAEWKTPFLSGLVVFQQHGPCREGTKCFDVCLPNMRAEDRDTGVSFPDDAFHTAVCFSKAYRRSNSLQSQIYRNRCQQMLSN